MNTFDERAREWDLDPEKIDRAQAAADAIRKAIPIRRSMKALEYGCGTGLLSFALQHDLGQITLADNSQGMLQVLREKINSAGVKNLHPIQLDLTKGALPARRFDLIYSLMVMHHIDDTRSMLGRFHQLLEPAGYLCICDLDQEDGSFHNYQFGGHLGFRQDELEKTACDAGFEDVQFSTAFTIHRHGKAYPLFLLAARKRNVSDGSRR